MFRNIFYLILAIMGFGLLIPFAAVEADGRLIWEQTTEIIGPDNAANDVAVHHTGVYVVGHQEPDPFYPPGANFMWRIEKRRLDDGTMEWHQISDITVDYDVARGVAVHDTGVYIVGYQGYDGLMGRWRIEKRRLDDGTIEWEAAPNYSMRYDAANAVAVDDTGVYIVGFSSDFAFPNKTWRVQKRDLTDLSNILWEETYIGSTVSPYSVAVDHTGVYVAGTESNKWRIEKRDLNTGALDWEQVGVLNSAQPRGVAVHHTGVYVAGYDKQAPGSRYQWRIEKRDLGSGSLIWVRQQQISTGNNIASGVAVDDTGVYVVGSQPSRWVVQKRDLDNGDIIWQQVYNESSKDVARGVAVDDTGVYIVGTENDVRWWRAEKRMHKLPDPPEARMGCDVDVVGCGGPGCVCSDIEDWVTYVGAVYYFLNDSLLPDSNTTYTSAWYSNGNAITDPCEEYGSQPSDCNAVCNMDADTNPYTILLRVEDQYNQISTTTQEITVRADINVNFQCSLTGVDNSWRNCQEIKIFEDQVVYFKDQSIPSDGATDIVAWQWEKGDGTIFEEFASSSIVSTTLASATSTIRLTAWDNTILPLGRSNSEIKSIDSRLPLPEYREVR